LSRCPAKVKLRWTRRRSQVVRQRSAKPLFAGSIPAGASLFGKDLRSDGNGVRGLRLTAPLITRAVDRFDAVSGRMARLAACDIGRALGELGGYARFRRIS
jgi:hypothetical protein